MEEQNESVNSPQVLSGDQAYGLAANALFEQKQSSDEAVNMLVENGLAQTEATRIVEELEEEFAAAKKKRGEKDMLYGALWCLGGIVATVSEIGYIFWGAIVFGAVQFIGGLIKSQS